ncbi:MAG: circadian clock KaiB family protein [Polyangiaceae bacterium]|jgi:circadian clock protein KaiB
MTHARKAPRGIKTDGQPEYLLRLFVSGLAPRSQRAIDNLRNLCERYLAGHHRIEVVDLYQSPGLARDEQIIATPTLVKVQPLPERRVIGDLSQPERVLHGLDIK